MIYKVREAAGIFIHVGGYYEKKDLKTYLSGSLGCLSIANRQIDEFIDDIIGRLENCEDKTIIINIAKRNDVEWQTDGTNWSVKPLQ